MITILTVTFNCEKYIKKCIRSVLSQTIDDWEMIIIDDVSKDNTRRIVRKFAQNDSRIRFYPLKKKLFCGSSYNYASTLSNGDIVCVLDGDDMIVSDALEIIKRVYDKYPTIDYIYTQHWTCNYKMKKLKLGISSLPQNGKDLLKSWQNRIHAFSHWRTCRSSMLNFPIFRDGLIFSVDKYMGMMLELHGQGGFLDMPLYLYRTYPGQLTTRLRKNRRKVNKECIKKILDYRQQKELTPISIQQVFDD